MPSLKTIKQRFFWIKSCLAVKLEIVTVRCRSEKVKINVVM